MKNILIVDDNKEVRNLVKAALGTEDYKIFEASTGQKAIESARKHNPDLIIMDVMMPEGEFDGIEAARQIKSDPLCKECKIIILTGSEKDRIEEGMAAGVSYFLIKPFSPLDLLKKIDSIFSSN